MSKPCKVRGNILGPSGGETAGLNWVWAKAHPGLFCGSCPQGICDCGPGINSRRVAGRSCELHPMLTYQVHAVGWTWEWSVVGRHGVLYCYRVLVCVGIMGQGSRVKNFVYFCCSGSGIAGLGCILGCGTGAVIVAPVTLSGGGFFSWCLRPSGRVS